MIEYDVVKIYLLYERKSKGFVSKNACFFLRINYFRVLYDLYTSLRCHLIYRRRLLFKIYEPNIP
jgi:hypothetical protein